MGEHHLILGGCESEVIVLLTELVRHGLTQDGEMYRFMTVSATRQHSPGTLRRRRTG